MQDNQKSKEELLRELNALRRRVVEFERAEEELLFKTALLEAQSETTIDGILVVDSEGKAVLFNKRFGQMWNIPEQILDDRDDEKMLRCVIEQLQEPDKFLERVKYLYSHKEEKSRDEIEFKDGKVFDRYSAPLLGPDGEYYGRIWYFRDITEHKQAGEKIKQAAKEWITTFDSISDLVWIQDKDFNIVRANKAFADTFKMKPEELIGKKCYEVVHGTKEPWPTCPHRQIFETRKPARAEFFEPNLGIHLEVSASPIFDERKEITGSVHITKDITERKQAAEELRKSEEHYRMLTETMNDGLGQMDEKGVLVYVNKKLGEILGYSPDEMIGRHWAKFFGPDAQETIKSHLVARRKGLAGAYEAVNTRKDGRKMYLRLSAQGVSDEQGKFKGNFAIITDITERKKAEETLHLYGEIITNMSEGVYAIRASDGVVFYTNPKFEEMFGYGPGELIGKHVSVVNAPGEKTPGETAAEIMKILNKQGSWQGEICNLKKDGVPFWCYASVSAFEHPEHGKVLVSTHTDITERKRSEETLRKSEERFKTIFENTAIGVYRTTPDGRILMANPALVRMLGYSSFEELAQRSLEKEGYEPQYPRSVFRERVEKDGQVVGLESAWVRRDGTTLYIIENSRVVRDENGNTLYYEGTAEDITERKKAEDALKESEERFRTIFDKAADGIMLADVESKKIYIGNRVICQMLGYDLEEVKKLGVMDVHPEEALAYVIEQFERQAKGELTLAKDIPVKRKDGSVFYADVNSFPVILAGKTYLMGIFRDITERKKAEDALRESEEKWRFLLQNTPDAILNLGRDGTILFINHTVRGYTVEETIGKTVYEFMPPEQHAKTRKAIEEVFETGEIVSYETSVVGADGELLWYSTRLGPVKDGDKIVSVAQISTNITEHHRMEQALHGSEEKYRTLVESADETIATIDENGVFLFMNRRGAEGLGGEPKDYIGKTMWDVFPREVAERQAMTVRSVINTGKGTTVTAITELQGQQRWYETIIEPLRDNKGEVIAALVIGRDVHEMRQAEEELARYREEMVRAERLASLGTLSATLAHELPQPLTVIRLSIENSLSELETMSCPKTIIEDLKDSLAGVSSVTSIAKRFRDFARRSSEKSVSKVDLKVIAERIVKLLNKSAQHAQVTLDVKEGMDNLPPVYTNEKDMEQLFFALVQNAIQAADGSKPCKLIINGAVKGKRIELRFSDNCGGIAPGDLDKIFEPFFTTKPAGEGTGLGLCIVRRIAVRSGGGVRVENKPGKGSTFVVTLGINRDSRS